MSRRRNDNGGGWIGILILVALVFAAIAWSLSTVGHAIGLTPTYTEAFESPDGWVSRHYEGVAIGYALTLAAMVTLAALVWAGIRSQSEDATRAAAAKARLAPLRIAGVLVVAGIVLLPVGRRDVPIAAQETAAAATIPDVVGMTASKAGDALRLVELEPRVGGDPSNPDRCRVVAQDPLPGAELRSGTVVELRCRIRVPAVVGNRPSTAEERLFDAGLNVRFANEPRGGGRDRCRVRSQSRTGRVPPNATVRLRLSCPEPAPKRTPTPEPESRCDPNYSGACLKPDSPDYDCRGGSGDGPDYTGPVTVVGDDHYGLNRDPDEDALGCEAS